jgi:hypothetical protein
VTSTSKEGLEKAVALIEDLMKKELPNLVDERRFRRREPEQVERDEFGRVSFIVHECIITLLIVHSANGLKRKYPSAWSQFLDLTFVRKSSGKVVCT